jgi:Flp pilus assembly protein TadG
MSRRKSNPSRVVRRRGAIVVLAAFMLIFMLAFVALAVDLGYLCNAKAEAQVSADAAALAAAWEFVDHAAVKNQVKKTMEYSHSAARQKAIDFAYRNRVAGVRPALDANWSNNPNGDIVFGRLDNPSDQSAPLDFHDPDNFNTVQVRVRRTAASNGGVPLFFASFFGHKTAEISATATAVFDDSIVGFRVTPQTPSSLLPFAMHVDSWLHMMDGAGDDNWTWDPETKSLKPGGDGIREIRLFGDSGGNGNAMNSPQSQPEWYVAWQSSTLHRPLPTNEPLLADAQFALGPGASWQTIVMPEMVLGKVSSKKGTGSTSSSGSSSSGSSSSGSSSSSNGNGNGNSGGSSDNGSNGNGNGNSGGNGDTGGSNGNGNGNGNSGGNGDTGGSNGNGNGGGSGGSNGNGSNKITPGNFGLIEYGESGNNANAVARLIRNGPTADDLRHMNGEFRLDSVTETILTSGTPGMKTSMKDDVESIVGQARTIPLYREVYGQGNNTTYVIVAFVGVRIVDFNFQGNDKYIIIQPAMVVDRSAISGHTNGTSRFVGQPVHLVR